MLHKTCDGKGLCQSSSWPPINSWVTDGTSLLTGGDFIQAVQVRGNLLPTVERSIRGRRNELPMCEAGCNAVSSLAHISQSCTRTHRLRSDRHNSIVDFIKNSLEKKGFAVVVEPNIVTRNGIRKPDLFVADESECRIVDVTITSDLFDMGNAYDQKVAYYCDEDVFRWAAEKWPGRLLSTNAVVYNWRGAIFRRSAGFLKQLGVKEFELKIMAARVLTYTYSMYRHYYKSTTRPTT